MPWYDLTGIKAKKQMKPTYDKNYDKHFVVMITPVSSLYTKFNPFLGLLWLLSITLRNLKHFALTSVFFTKLTLLTCGCCFLWKKTNKTLQGHKTCLLCKCSIWGIFVTLSLNLKVCLNSVTIGVANRYLLFLVNEKLTLILS